VKKPEGVADIVSAAKSYFQTRLAMGENSIVLTTARKHSGAAERPPAEALARLEKRAARCKRCPLHKTRTNVVFGTGSGKTGLVFVGEAPGRDEDLQGKPFVGRAGQLLTRIIEAVKLEREDVYITNVVKCRPENNRDPLPREIELCSTYLIEQIEILKPKAICALGRFAAEAMSGIKLSMSDYRHQDLSYKGTRVIATYHPAACLRNPSLKRPVWEDVQKLMEVWKNA
jgi:DNA polymerase